MKKIVLLDLDNTLIDFNLCAKHSLENIFKDIGYEFTDQSFQIFIRENNNIWKRLEKGEITKSYLRENRFKIILEKLNVNYSGEIVEERFEEGVKNSAFPVEGAKELLDYLYNKYDLYLVSNGFRFIQENRLRLSHFDKYFKELFLSEDIGIQKPDERFFDYCFKGLNNPPKDDVILIGDSLTADIKGGEKYALDTIWFNKDNIPNETDIKPTYTVYSLKEIENIL